MQLELNNVWLFPSSLRLLTTMLGELNQVSHFQPYSSVRTKLFSFNDSLVSTIFEIEPTQICRPAVARSITRSDHQPSQPSHVSRPRGCSALGGVVCVSFYLWESSSVGSLSEIVDKI